MYVVILLLPLANAAYLPKDQNHPDLNMTVFPPLMNKQIKAVKVTESEFPWVARVVHSSKGIYPHICTAICVSPRLFLTAVRCFSRVRLSYTHVWYQNSSIPSKAFVIPEYHTQQRYDDIGIIITKAFNPGGNWPRLKIFNERNRTDPRFKWFKELHFEKNRNDYYVIGYACQEKDAMYSRGPYDLTKLKVMLDINICRQLTRWDETSRDYYVPCYHTCNIVEHKHNDDRCKGYHGVEGGAVVNMKTKTLMGVATWGAYTIAHNLPVGFAVPNSQAFFKDYECAKRIRDDQSSESENFTYTNFCDDLVDQLDIEFVEGVDR